jgi:hypothetical protein
MLRILVLQRNRTGFVIERKVKQGKTEKTKVSMDFMDKQRAIIEFQILEIHSTLQNKTVAI